MIDDQTDGSYRVKEGESKTIIDGGGNDTITVEKGGHVNITNDEDPNSSNTIVAEGVDAEDVVVVREGDDAIIIIDDGNGRPTYIRLTNHFSENGPGTNTLTVAPDENGNGGNGGPIDLNDPSNYSSFGNILAASIGSGIQGLNDWIDGVADYYGLSFFFGSPLVLDLDGDGIELISKENSTVFWDIDEDGFSEASGWIAPDDGFLAVDLDGDGTINSHAELFGSITVDGFSVLSNYDTNLDSVIDGNDTQYGDLLVWQDVNGNGISETGELFTLSDLDIVSIDLNASTPTWYPPSRTS